MSLVSLVQPSTSTTPARPDPLRVAAQELETVFLSEMLKSAGLGESPDARGGIGEEQFASFLRDAQAHEMVRAGGLGLSDALYQSLLAASHARD